MSKPAAARPRADGRPAPAPAARRPAGSEEDSATDSDFDEEEELTVDQLADLALNGDSATTVSKKPAPAAPTVRAAAPPAGVNPDLVMHTVGGKLLHMHREPWGQWSMTDYAAIQVRSRDYVRTGVKIPPPCPPTMEIVHLEMYMCDTQIYHVCSYKDNWLQKYKASQPKPAAASKTKPLPRVAPGAPLPDLSSGAGLRPFDPDFFFVVNFHVQTAPTFHLTMYFQRRDVARAAATGSASSKKDAEEYHEPVAAAQAKTAFDTLFERFIEGDTAFRNTRLKLIPFVVDGGNWFVNKAVGNRPAIIGSKIATNYHCDPHLNYMEVDIDVSGSSLGSGIFKVVKVRGGGHAHTGRHPATHTRRMAVRD